MLLEFQTYTKLFLCRFLIWWRIHVWNILFLYAKSIFVYVTYNSTVQVAFVPNNKHYLKTHYTSMGLRFRTFILRCSQPLPMTMQQTKIIKNLSKPVREALKNVFAKEILQKKFYECPGIFFWLSHFLLKKSSATLS